MIRPHLLPLCSDSRLLAAGMRRQAVTAVPRVAGGPKVAVKRWKWKWKDNPAILYGIPSVVLLSFVFYLVLTPTPSPTSTSSSVPRGRSSAPSVLFSADDGECHPLSVLDDVDAHMRLLRCGDCVLGGEYLSANISVFTSSYLQASVALATSLHSPPTATPLTYLVIGLGAGHVASVFHHLFHMEGDAVDQSETIFQLAATYFAYSPSRRMVAQTAEAFIDSLQFDEKGGEGGSALCRRRGEYDVVSIDLFDATNRLSSLTVYTQHSLQALDCTLTPRGILSVSLVYSRKPRIHLRSPHSLYLTLSSIFPHVVAYDDGGKEDVGNVVFMASHSPVILDLSSLQLPEGFVEDVEMEKTEEEDDGLLALQYAVGFWRQQISKRRIDWESAHTSDSKGKRLYSPTILNGQHKAHAINHSPTTPGSHWWTDSLPHHFRLCVALTV